MDKQSTLKEIAASSGVSIASISRYMNNNNSVKESTRNKIEMAIKLSNRKKELVKTNLIALILPDLDNQFFPQLINGINTIGEANNKNIIICNSHSDKSTEAKLLQDLIGIGVDGIICICASNDNDHYRMAIEEYKIPIVFMDRSSGLKNSCTVSSDGFNGMYQATRYLISLGHKDIIYLGGPKGISTDKERYDGFLSAMKDSSLYFDPNNRIECDYNYDIAYQKTKELVQEKKAFTAICSANDFMALGAYKALNDCKIRIPEDVSIIGFDDIPTSKLIDLTTVRQPYEEIGKAAILELLSMIASPFPPAHDIKLSASIQIRKTCSISCRIK